MGWKITIIVSVSNLGTTSQQSYVEKIDFVENQIQMKDVFTRFVLVDNFSNRFMNDDYAMLNMF